MTEEESRALLKFAFEEAEVKTVSTIASNIKSQFPELFENFRQNSQIPIPQWSDRKALNIKLKAHEWVRTYYGNKSGDGTWDAKGLKRSMLRDLDFGLYQAYNGYIRRLRDNNIPIPNDLKTLEETPSQRVDQELKSLGVTKTKDVNKALTGSVQDADRLKKAAQRRFP